MWKPAGELCKVPMNKTSLGVGKINSYINMRRLNRDHHACREKTAFLPESDFERANAARKSSDFFKNSPREGSPPLISLEDGYFLINKWARQSRPQKGRILGFPLIIFPPDIQPVF